MAASPCPNCRATLETVTLEALYGRSLAIDLCAPCQGLWFDDGEGLQLAPHGTLTLFRFVHERHGERRHPLAERLECPRCRLRLSLTVDQQRSTKFQYYRCARGHGRFITFFHFLRARNFVRSLTRREVADLRTRVKQVNCSNCGAPVNLEEDVSCRYCRAPVSMLDPNQVQATLAELREADARRQRIDPSLPLTLMTERLKVERVFAEAEAAARRESAWPGPLAAGDGLVEAGLGLLVDWLSGARGR